MSLADLSMAGAAEAGGVVGVVLILIAYAGAQIGRLEATGAPALLLNLVGAALVLVSLAYSFNLAAFIMESAWALVAIYGLAKLARKRRSPR